ncbi:MAG TPA: ComF family protein [Paludibacteraceae bacterium]|nr:ComF family protein [Paludibacteraceae bacterium]HOU67234.1 ComF family protein [Paludibacteraceae bacterium]HPH62310.1 ComF family protein [Paludibacteraceae bacterium]HQF49303.1 ComF family protein [Paludibacteraceae bacterium]HQJ89012.1 ComF family protein [Paludibacteraceae bacterium]
MNKFKPTELFKDFINLFYPKLCVGCGNALFKGEKFICLHCLNDLARTKYHTIEGNSVEQRFYGKVEVQHATSFLYFEKKSMTQKFMHEIKYKGEKELGEHLGKIFGADLKRSWFDEIDAIIPVPLHSKRLKERGYNQSEWIAQGIARSMGKPLITDALIRESATQTQTKKGVYERWQNVNGIFKVINPTKIENKHILVIDDVITTGATIEACISGLISADGVKVSVATLAVAE